MKITIDSRDTKTTKELAYIGIKAIGEFLKQGDSSKDPVIFANIINQMEIVWNNILKNPDLYLNIPNFFANDRALVAHVGSFYELFTKQKNALKSYYEGILLPLKDTIEKEIEIDASSFVIETSRSISNILDFNKLYNFMLQELSFITNEKHRKITAEILVAKYVLGTEGTSFETLSFARVIIQSIREQYKNIMQSSDQKMKKLQQEIEHDPFYQMIYIRNQFAHSKYPDLYGANPAELLDSLMGAVGISNNKYTKYITKLDKAQAILPQSITNELDIDLQNGAPIRKIQDKTQHKHKVSKRSVCKKDDDLMVVDGVVLQKSNSYSSGKIYEISQQLTILFIGLLSIIQKADVSNTKALLAGDKTIPYIELKSSLSQSLINQIKKIQKEKLDSEIGSDILKDLIQRLQNIIDTVAQVTLDQEKLLAKFVENPDCVTQDEFLRVDLILSRGKSSKELAESIKSLKDIAIGISQHEFFDPNLKIKVAVTNILRNHEPSLHYPSSVAEIIEFNFDKDISYYKNAYNGAISPIKKSAATFADIMPFDENLLRTIITKGNIDDFSRIFIYLMGEMNVENIRKFLILCSQEGLNLTKTLNSSILHGFDIREFDDISTQRVQNVTFIKPLKLLEHVATYIVNLSKKGFPDAEIEKEMSKVYECSELFLNYGADIKGSDTTIFGATEGLGDVSLI